MEREVEKVIDLWKDSYSSALKKYSPYRVTHQLRQLAALFSPGMSYYYILNFHNLEFEYISDSVEEITGFKKDEVSIQNLLSIAIPEDLPMLQKKELTVQDFVNSFPDHMDLLNYKVMYTYCMKDLRGRIRTMLLQNTPLSVSDEGKLEHLLTIHTDVSHLKLSPTNTISCIHLDGGKSYYNVDASQGKFDPDASNPDQSGVSELTKREIEIAKLLAKGMNAEKIAEELNVSFNTVRTHRKNMLQKLGCSNTTELVVKCISAGLVGY